jgi:hypothetical protein
MAGGNNPFLVENAATAGNNPVPVGTEETGGSNNLAGTSLLRILNQLPLLFPGQPVPPVNQVVPPFQIGGSDGDAFGAFGAVYLRESSSVVNPFPDGNEATAGNNPVPIGSEEIGGSNDLGGTDLSRLPGLQLPVIFPGQPIPSVNQPVPSFSEGGSNGKAFAAFSKVFLKEDSSGGN